MITFTEAAKEKIIDILVHEGPNTKLRMFIQGGGCSGFNYGFSIDTEQNEDDFLIPLDSVSILIDAMSLQYLQGSTLNYKNSLMGSNFEITNPNAVSTCGCGSSFAI